MTRTKTYVLTAASAVVYVLLCWVFADGLFKLDDLWISDSIADSTIWTYLMLAAIVGAGLYQARQLPTEGVTIQAVPESAAGQVDDPTIWKLLTGNVYFAILWLPLRFFVGREWLSAGEHKLRDDAWMDGGTALVNPDPEVLGYWERVVSPEAAPNPTYAWFTDFIQYLIDHEWASFFGKLIAVGEFLVGLGLVVGALVGIAAFFGTVLNVNFLLAGTASSNPVLFGLSVFIIIGWKVAGYWGLDRYLLPALGTPWRPGATVSRPFKLRNRQHEVALA
jgi:thiosulfate dehydrogenase [quinone] large subunit